MLASAQELVCLLCQFWFDLKGSIESVFESVLEAV